MTRNKKKSLLSNNKVIESAWDAYFKESQSITLDSLKEDGWLTCEDIAKKFNITRSSAAVKMKKDNRVICQHFNVHSNGCLRKMTFFKVK